MGDFFARLRCIVYGLLFRPSRGVGGLCKMVEEGRYFYIGTGIMAAVSILNCLQMARSLGSSDNT